MHRIRIYQVEKNDPNFVIKVYVLAVPKARGKAEREGLEKVVQFLIEQRVLFHLAEVETQT